MAIQDTLLYAGGFFHTLGGRASYHFGIGSEVLGSGVDVESPSVPEAAGVAFLSVFPNPITETSTIQFTVPRAMYATMVLYDIRGRLVRRLFEGDAVPSVAHDIRLDGSGLSSGLFFLRLTGEGMVRTQKVIVLH
jgi:hypothetical protein